MRQTRHRRRTSSTSTSVPNGALALAVMLALLISATPSAAQTFTVAYTFAGGVDGRSPYAGVITDAAGNLYGTTALGGAFNQGTVFKIDPSGNETVLHSFAGGTDGAYPYSGLVRDGTGRLYGTTSAGGGTGCHGGGCGIVFKLSKNGTETVLYRFAGGADGGIPYAGLIMDSAGKLYGTTEIGGNLNCGAGFGCGTVFKLTKSGAETVLYRFSGGTDGGFPYASLVFDPKGNLYGTTQKGGDLNCNAPFGCGVVYKLTKAGTETVLHSFEGGKDGGFPTSGLTYDGLGRPIIYGTLPVGGKSGEGMVYRIKLKTLQYALLHSFGSGSDGTNPVASMSSDASGNLYGTTEAGGTLGYGILFQLDTTGNEVVLHNFDFASDGGVPLAAPIYDPGCGCLLGTTLEGGTTDNGPGSGTVFTWKRGLPVQP